MQCVTRRADVADYYLNRYPSDHPGSLINLLVSSILPSMVRNTSRPHAPLVIINTGSVRFDLSAGPMTRDSQAVRCYVEFWLTLQLVMPFLNRAVFIRDVPRRIAAQLPSSMHGEPGDEDLRGGEYQSRQAAVKAFETAAAASDKLSYGYVTRDGCSLDGQPADDTPHRSLPAYRLPEYVGTAMPERGDLIDVVVFDFIWPVLVRQLNKLQSERIYTARDIEPYSDARTDTLLIEYARRFWPLK